MTDYARAQQLIPVVGRLHMKEHIEYWKKKIQAPSLIINWLRYGIPLFPRELIQLSMKPDPPQYPMTEEQHLWLDLEIKRLLTTKAIALVARSEKRPDHLLEVSPIFLTPKSGPKKWRLIIDLRRLNITLPEKSFKFEGFKTFLRMVGQSWWVIVLI